MYVRAENSGDYAAVHEINSRAFDREDEANLVDILRAAGIELISLVAEITGGKRVGHALFSPVQIDYPGRDRAGCRAIALGPIGVLPEFQGSGVGAALIEVGLEACRQQGYDLVFVLGHSSYYPRFGFKQAGLLNFRCEWDVPEEAFMVLKVGEAADCRGGIVRYHPAFSQV